MHLPLIGVIVGLEILLALLVLCLLALLYVRKLRALLARQQEQLRQAMEKAMAPAAPAPVAQPAPVSDPKTHLAEQLAATLEHFQALAPEVDIDQTEGAELDEPARISATRYALLKTELEATENGGWQEDHWQALAERLAPLLASDDSANLEQELANAQKRVANLEKFKKLFFEMEDQWEQARGEAQEYYNQLSALSSGVDDQERFDELLAKYHAVYDDIDQQIASASERKAPDPSTQTEHKTITITRADPRTAEELTKLRNVAADQHRIINKLQKQLQDAESAEQKEEVIQGLQTQLEQQLRYVKESETCVQLLESELETAVAKLNEYEMKAGQSAQNDDEMEQMRATLHQFTLETKDLLKHLDALEKENQTLKSTGGPASAADPTAGNALAQLREKYAELEFQYAELEEKYLELRSQ
ncbi:hypothetical protein [Gilvimarinus algae]|uniref:Uncharacterized protein n=1 Tax=Gilvimarinus algae TaxID=3058037 RepID=A0ABT8T907_9GAMM|nr:hypothetical protein [Gilvimarinus sp. SDUM040014]MDO3380567.1 hypothetical protein [Gilvimarinus sp. SDUM040014]